MATKDITDLQVCQAVARGMSSPWRELPPALRAQGPSHHRHLILAEITGQHPNVAWRALERAEGRGLIDCGVGLQGAFLTDAGRELLATAEPVPGKVEPGEPWPRR